MVFSIKNKTFTEYCDEASTLFLRLLTYLIHFNLFSLGINHLGAQKLVATGYKTLILLMATDLTVLLEIAHNYRTSVNDVIGLHFFFR